MTIGQPRVSSKLVWPLQGFRGTIEMLDHQRYVMNGEVAEISETTLEITELPVRTWTQTYKEQVGPDLAF